MSKYITDEMVARAARAEWDHDFPNAPWDGAGSYVRDNYRNGARAALEVTASAIAAQALRDFAASMHSEEWEHRDDWGVSCAYAVEVRACADEIEASVPPSPTKGPLT